MQMRSMKKTVLVLFLILFGAPSAFAESPAVTTAINKVVAAYKKYGKQVSSLSMSCIMFMREDGDPGEIDIAAREDHNKGCGGDPDVAPIVARFIVKKNKVFIEDPIDMSQHPFDASYKG